jgi:hypothetical protein
MPKPAWIAVIAATFIGGAIAWLIVRQPVRAATQPGAPSRWNPDDYDGYPDGPRWTDEDDAVARHPAGRARATNAPKGPDDDPEFLRALDRAIRGDQ